MLVPLTGSLYVNGTVASEGKVLIDIGTGYYVEVCFMLYAGSAVLLRCCVVHLKIKKAASLGE